MTSEAERAAYDALDQAIKTLLEAKGLINNDPPLVLTDWIVFSASTGYMDDGDPVTGYSYLLCNEGSMPVYRALGLAKVGTTQLLSTMVGDDDE